MPDIEKRTMDKVTWRLVPFLMLCYFIAYLDRVNIGFAGASMSKDLGLTAAAFGGAAGIFFVAYFFFEVPSNLALDRFGARLWIARIMLTWGIVAGGQAFVQGELSLNIVRLLLGVAEAGFFPGIIFFLTLWFPAHYRARIVGLFMFAIPISTVIGAPISGLILNLEGVQGLHGWQWMFILEALPALAMSAAVYLYLTDRPKDALWLAPAERQWLQDRLAAERATREQHGAMSWFRSMLDPRVIALGFVYMGCNIPQYGLSFFLPQIVKAFGGLSNLEIGIITALPYAVGAIGMILWSRHSDQTGERKWHAVIPLGIIAIGLVLAAMMPNPALTMVFLCVAGFGFFAVLPVFWTLPTTFLSGVGAAAGIAAVNSIGNLGGYFGPKVFGWLKDTTGGDYASLMFLAGCAIVGAAIVLALGHNPALERPMAMAKAER
jgi:ACS family tartrate transporter-like MFS transporter